MMKFGKKVYLFVLAIAVLLSIGTITAFANNYSDTNFSFTFAPQSSAPVYTQARAKTDHSSSYMKLKSLSRSDGAYYASVVRKDHTNFSKTWTYRFDRTDLNVGRYLLNYAYEDDGETFVRIKATRAVSPNIGFTASGVWSPDSI
ncbi:hypothetical protein [Caenibacillus caldisaponilyticus]|uniref:hypothetical protein n=1 Tax=Caenibacillus caldisaponilyticus TaxID=1674942 RepID=UPI00098853E3|nr:hypothetical protein [Caenibacillus caldisaponilyticus]